MNWCLRPATEQRAALDRGEISATELLEATIHQGESIRGDVNPLAVTLYDRAAEAADAAERALRKRRGGPLCGLPVTVKDSQWLAGVPCANGSPTLRDFIPASTSESIRRLEEAGAVVFAKTTCPEFCVSGTNHSPLYGPTRNPWHLSYTPGGSSGGAAAAVASGVGALALGSDGGGSIRIPAAFCGVVGFKPSHGAVPRYPGFETWESLVAYGPLARSVADARLMTGVLSGDRELLTEAGGVARRWRRYAPGKARSSAELPELTTIVASMDLGFAPLDEDVRNAFDGVLSRLRDAGLKVRRDHPGLKSSIVTWATVATRDMWDHKQHHLAPDVAESDLLGRTTEDFIRFGATFNDCDIADAMAWRREILTAYTNLFRRNHCQVLVTPSLGCEAFPGHRTHPARIGDRDITYPWLDWAGFLYDANLAGMPACSIPMGLGDEGLPLGLQVIGLPGMDRAVLSAAETIEQLIDWPHATAPRFDAPAIPPATILGDMESGGHPAH